ncbi:unnamed protein product [Alopecurus aequalis]
MAGRRQRMTISQNQKKKKNKKTRAATMKKEKKIVKESTRATQEVVARFFLQCTTHKGDDVVGFPDLPRLRRRRVCMFSSDNEARCDRRTCDVCGVGGIQEHDNLYFCPYNYIDGLFGLRTCRERCHPGMHPLLLGSSGSSPGNQHQLMRVVRVTNVPLSVIPGRSELLRLFRQFRPLARCNLTSVSLDDPVGFGWVAFESLDHAQEAIDKLNGHLVGDRKLRVDWTWPEGL